MQGIAPVSRVSGVRRVLPSPDARSASGEARSPAAALEVAGPLTGSHAPAAGVYAPFLVQALANDNVSATARITANHGAIAYLLNRDLPEDLPVGFLISKIA